MKKLSPAMQRALADLRSRVAALPQKSRLPTVAALAAQAGVAKATMSKAVGQLKTEGVLQVAQGSGIRVCSQSALHEQPTSDSDSAVNRTPRWIRVRDSVAHDIMQGAYPPGSRLPSFKELCSRYETSYPVARKALATLSLVEQSRRGYRVRGALPRRDQSTLIFAAHTSDTEQLCRYTNRMPDFWRTLQRWCFDNRVSLTITTVQEAERVCAQHRSVLGCIFWADYLDSATINVQVSRLSRQRIRTALMREQEIFTPSHEILHSPHCRIFSAVSHRDAGKAIAEHLLSLGHTKIAVFNRAAEIDWARKRLEGLTGACRDAGFASAVQPIAWEQCDTWNLMFQKHVSTDNPHVRQVLRDMAHLERVLQTRYGHFYRHQLELRLTMLDHLQFEALLPHIDSLLADRSITAWVGIHDTIAYRLNDYLAGKHVAIGRDISLAGFDDDLDSFAAGLTSYNYNITALVIAMCEFLTGALQMPTRKNGIVTIPGYVMARQSTGRAPKILT